MRRDLLEVLTVGLPFCGFKIIAGLSLGGAGWLLVGLGVIDALINAINLAGLLAYRTRPMSACTLALATYPFRGTGGSPQKWVDLGNSLDVLLAFALVALMIGFGRLGALPAERLAVWNACVILNVLGAGLARFGASVRDLARD
ncbi:MAG: hypothetical protein NUW21_10200 [Elusimicrobia bacterium]|nr:hypothetical protein [Elusimicrobiota bacterium]